MCRSSFVNLLCIITVVIGNYFNWVPCFEIAHADNKYEKVLMQVLRNDNQCAVF